VQEPKLNTALVSKLQSLQTKVNAQQLTIRGQKQRIADLCLSRTLWKDKYKALKTASVRPKATPPKSLRPAGYQYDLPTIGLSVWLYVLGGCSYRNVVKVLLYLQTEWALSIDVPSKSSVVGWVEKVGCYQYEHPPQPTTAPYALLVDECMVIGGQRLVVILGLPAQKAEVGATRFEQVWLLSLAVRASWTGEAIKDQLEKVIEKRGSQPEYVISDGATTLKKGIADAGLVRISDVSHQVALLLQHRYQRQPLFVAWQQALAQSKFKYIMTDSAYLLPPKQRSVARFMNLWACIEWSERLLAALPTLSEPEQKRFGWLGTYSVLIEELGASFGLSRQVVAYVQANGLSQASVKACQALISKSGAIGGVQADLVSYLVGELAKVGGGGCWHGCTNVLESLFGHYKSGLPTNPLAGVSGVVLSLSLRTGEAFGPDLCQALESVSLADLQAWKEANLAKSQVVRRRKVLEK
jgi:hypothetical protein